MVITPEAKKDRMLSRPGSQSVASLDSSVGRAPVSWRSRVGIQLKNQ